MNKIMIVVVLAVSFLAVPVINSTENTQVQQAFCSALANKIAMDDNIINHSNSADLNVINNIGNENMLFHNGCAM